MTPTTPPTPNDYVRREAYSHQDELLKALCSRIFGDELVDIDKVDDRVQQKAGIDYVLTLTCGAQPSVELKSRDNDWGDMFCEYISVDKFGSLGWAERNLQCQALVYLFEPTRRAYVMQYRDFKTAWDANKRDWYTEYGGQDAKNNTDLGFYRSWGVCVPEKELLRTIPSFEIVRF